MVTMMRDPGVTDTLPSCTIASWARSTASNVVVVSRRSSPTVLVQMDVSNSKPGAAP
jgi:hypothetical protein